MTETVSKFHVKRAVYEEIFFAYPWLRSMFCIFVSGCCKAGSSLGWGAGVLGSPRRAGSQDLSQDSPEPGSQGHRDSPGHQSLPGNRDRLALGWALQGCKGLETSPAVASLGGGWWPWGLQWAPRVWAGCAKQGHSGPWCCTCFCGLSTEKVPSMCYKCIRRLPAFIDTLHFAFLHIMWQTYICLLKTVHITLWMW